MRIFLFFLVLLASARSEAMNLGQYREAKGQQPIAVANYLGAIGTGYTWANADLEADKKQALYCPPRGLALNGMNYVQIVDDYIKLRIDLDGSDTPIALLLLNALKREFPCESPKT